MGEGGCSGIGGRRGTECGEGGRAGMGTPNIT